LTETRIEQAYREAEAHEQTDGPPGSVWGMVNGITRLSQREPWADVRTALDRAAGRLLDEIVR
jgi:hypothetical protein